MNRLKAAALAAALVTSPIALHAPLAAQVTEIDVHMAEFGNHVVRHPRRQGRPCFTRAEHRGHPP